MSVDSHAFSAASILSSWIVLLLHASSGIRRAIGSEADAPVFLDRLSAIERVLQASRLPVHGADEAAVLQGSVASPRSQR